MRIFFRSGEMEFEASDGKIRPGVPGKAILAGGRDGKGSFEPSRWQLGFDARVGTSLMRDLTATIDENLDEQA